MTHLHSRRSRFEPELAEIYACTNRRSIFSPFRELSSTLRDGPRQTTGMTPLMYAVKDNRASYIDRLIDLGSDVGARNNVSSKDPAYGFANFHLWLKTENQNSKIRKDKAQMGYFLGMFALAFGDNCTDETSD